MFLQQLTHSRLIEFPSSTVVLVDAISIWNDNSDKGNDMNLNQTMVTKRSYFFVLAWFYHEIRMASVDQRHR